MAVCPPESGVNMNKGISVFLWQLAVALYLIANGVLGLQRWSGGDFLIIFKRMGFSGNALSTVVVIASIIAFLAGVAVILELFSIELPFLDTLVFIVAIIWAVYIVIEIVSWLTGGLKDFFHELQLLAVHIMVLASLLTASKRFE
jgi:hypothetical protein